MGTRKMRMRLGTVSLDAKKTVTGNTAQKPALFDLITH